MHFQHFFYNGHYTLKLIPKLFFFNLPMILYTKMITEHNIFDTNTTSYTLFIYTPFFFLFFIPFLQLIRSSSHLRGSPSRHRLCKPPSLTPSATLSHTPSGHHRQLHPSLQIRQQPPLLIFKSDLSLSSANPFWPATGHRLQISLCLSCSHSSL